MSDLSKNDHLWFLRGLDRDSELMLDLGRLTPFPRKMIYFSNPTGCNWVKNIWNEEMATNDQEMR